jgi:hypothetical protein
MISITRSLLISFVVLGLVGCATLPDPTPGTGLVILAMKFDNSSSISEPIHKVDLDLSNGKAARFVPKSGYYVFQGTDPPLVVKDFRMSLRLDRWSGGESIMNRSMELQFQAGKIVYLPYLFHYAKRTCPASQGTTLPTGTSSRSTWPA